MDKETWVYNYEIEYWSHELEQRIRDKGAVVGIDMDDCYEALKKYYLDAKDEFDMIKISAREDGDIVTQVIPFNN